MKPNETTVHDDAFFSKDKRVPVTVKIQPILKQKFKMLVIAHNTTVQAVLEKYIAKWVEDHG